MSDSGLRAFGVEPSTAVRLPTTDKDGQHRCAECAHPIEKTKGTPRVAFPDVEDDDMADAIGQSIVTIGWVCGRHAGRVVHPQTSIPDSDGKGWTGVDIRYADDVVRTMPVPVREVES